LKGKIEKKNQFNKRLKKTIKIMIKLKKKRYLKNWDWMMKLKTNKTCIKGPTIKIKNQKNKDWSWNTNNKEDQTIIFGRKGEKRREKIGLLATN